MVVPTLSLRGEGGVIEVTAEYLKRDQQKREKEQGAERKLLGEWGGGTPILWVGVLIVKGSFLKDYNLNVV